MAQVHLQADSDPLFMDLWPPRWSWDLVVPSSPPGATGSSGSCDTTVCAATEGPITAVTWQVRAVSDASMWALFSNELQPPPRLMIQSIKNVWERRGQTPSRKTSPQSCVLYCKWSLNLYCALSSSFQAPTDTLQSFTHSYTTALEQTDSGEAFTFQTELFNSSVYDVF